VQKRKEAKMAFLNFIKENTSLPEDRVCGLFSLKNGLSEKVVRQYFKELRMADLIQISAHTESKMVEGDGMKIVEEEKRKEAEEAERKVKDEAAAAVRDKRISELIPIISQLTQTIVRLKEEGRDDDCKRLMFEKEMLEKELEGLKKKVSA